MPTCTGGKPEKEVRARCDVRKRGRIQTKDVHITEDMKDCDRKSYQDGIVPVHFNPVHVRNVSH